MLLGHRRISDNLDSSRAINCAGFLLTISIHFRSWQSLWPYTHETFSLFRLISSHFRRQQHGINSPIPSGPSNPYGLQTYIANTELIISITDSIEKILNLNQDPVQSTEGHAEPNASNGTGTSAPILNSDGDPIWKVLVFDDLGRDVISSVLRVNDLRAWGVTMHMYVKRNPRHCSSERKTS
jgi:hypothetical protein